MSLRRARTRIAWLAAAVAAGLAPPHAWADPVDEFGFGARASGLAGAHTALAEGADAAHANPAALALAQRPALLLGYGYGAMGLEVNGEDAGILDARGGSVGVGIPFQLGPVRIGVGAALYLPDAFVARVQLVPATEPHFGLLDNDPQRMVVDLGLGARLGRWVALGVGASIFSDTGGRGVAFDVGVANGERVGEAGVDVELPIHAAPILSVVIAPSEPLRGCLAYRGALALDLALDVLADVDVANVVTGDVLVSLRATNFYTPARATAAIAGEPTAGLTLTGEVTWTNWSAHPGVAADLRVLIDLDTAPPTVGSTLPAPNFEDTLSVRAGAEWTAPSAGLDWSLRGGYAYLPTPVPEQTGLTSIADNDRHLLAIGVGVTAPAWRPVLEHPISFGIALQWHHLAARLTVKDDVPLAGGALSSGGDILYLGSSTTVRF